MPPTLLLVRHAQALHNVASDWSLHDPPLSSLGEAQCEELQEALKKEEIAEKVELIVVSAMRRTLQTAKIGLRWLWEEKKIPVLPDAGWQENADKPCDTGSPIQVMATEFPEFDFSKVDPLYPDKTTNLHNNPYAFTGKAILARGQTCLKSLYSRPEKVIAVVSHSGFLRVAVCNRRFFNADYRIFEYDEEAMQQSKRNGEGIDGQGLFVLKEWPETEEKGGGMGRSEKGVFKYTKGDYPEDDQPPEVQEEQTKELPSRTAANVRQEAAEL